ncbi:ATP-binding cassette sub-family G member 1-like [Amblyomma americanum]
MQSNGDLPEYDSTDIIILEDAADVRQSLRPRRCQAVALEWKDISFHVQADKRKKALLSNLYGRAAPGTLTAIMGPSGAGKTTLLNILSGYYDKGYEGEVHVNDYIRDSKLFNMQSCYVMQGDCLLQELTVREALTISVELRMPALECRKIPVLVDDTISRWGLDECADTMTRFLSGGEKRRLAISQELVSNPPVVFLDEPTSGLDSSSALRCTHELKSLAASGHTVLCSIHNPSSVLFSHFDWLYMLSEGKCIYHGLVGKLLPFLESQNLHCPLYNSPSDFITEIASGQHRDVVLKLSMLFIPGNLFTNNKIQRNNSYELTIYGGRLMSPKDKKQEEQQYKVEAKPYQQFKTLSKRCFYCVIRNKTTSLARIGVSLFFAFLLSIVYYGSGNRAAQARDIVAMYLMALALLLFQTVGPTVLTFPLEIDVLLREQRNCWYSLWWYYVAKILSDLPFMIVGPVIMMSIVHWTTFQPAEFYRLALIILFSIQMCCTSQSIAYVCSAMFKAQTAVCVCLPALAPSYLFCGYFVQPRYLHTVVAWLTYTSHIYYLHQAIMFALYGNGRGQLECDERDVDILCVPIDGNDVLHMVDAQDVNLLAYSLIVLAIDVSLKLVAFGFLKWRLWRKWTKTADFHRTMGQLYMLSEGKCIYHGLVEKLLPFLESQNLRCPLYNSPSDFITEIASGQHGDVILKLSTVFIPCGSCTNNKSERTDSSEFTVYGGRLMTPEEKKQEVQHYKVEAKSYQQFKTLTKRCFYCVIRNKATSFTRIGISLFFAVLLSIMYYGSGNRAAQARDVVVMYLLALAMLLFQTVGPTVLTFPLEIDVLLREQRNCWYSLWWYYMAKILSDLPFMIVCPVIMMGIIHWTTFQPAEFCRLALILLFSIQMCCTCQSLAYVCSAIFKIETAVCVCLPALTPSYLFCGYFVQPRYLHTVVAWLTYTSHIYYLHQAIMFALYGNGRGQLECDERDVDVLCVPIDGNDVLHMVHAQDVNLLAYSLIVLAIDVSLKLIAFGFLKWRLWRKC